MHILDHIEDKKTLMALCHTSRMLRALALRVPFQVINPGYNPSRTLRVLNSLRHHELAANISEFYVSLAPDTCWLRGIGPNQTCCCNELDHMLGEPLKGMVNLINLSIQCPARYCARVDKNVERHLYLTKLETHNLRSFSFLCSCSEWEDHHLERLISVPILAKVEALQWSVLSGQHSTSLTKDYMIQNLPLPLLTAFLHHQRMPINDIILANRPIRRLGITPYDMASVIRAIPSSTLNMLTHLVTTSDSRAYHFLQALPLRLVPHLQHIGTICISPHNPTVNLIKLFTSFNFLSHLESVNSVVSGEEDPWRSPELLSQIASLHPNLRRILLKYNSRCFVLSRGVETWTRREVAEFTLWDIVRGACDHL